MYDGPRTQCTETDFYRINHEKRIIEHTLYDVVWASMKGWLLRHHLVQRELASGSQTCGLSQGIIICHKHHTQPLLLQTNQIIKFNHEAVTHLRERLWAGGMGKPIDLIEPPGPSTDFSLGCNRGGTTMQNICIDEQQLNLQNGNPTMVDSR